MRIGTQYRTLNWHVSHKFSSYSDEGIFIAKNVEEYKPLIRRKKKQKKLVMDLLIYGRRDNKMYLLSHVFYFKMSDLKEKIVFLIKCMSLSLPK